MAPDIHIVQSLDFGYLYTLASCPIGSPGMEGGTPEPYEVVLFGPGGRRSYMRFVGEKAIG